MRYFFLNMLGAFILTGCTNASSPGMEEPQSTGNPTAADLLEVSSHADIFQFNGLIYSKGSHLAWVLAEDYQKGEQIGEITKQTSISNEFVNGAANKLPVGTGIFKTIEDSQRILIAENDGNEVIYIALMEG